MLYQSGTQGSVSQSEGIDGTLNVFSLQLGKNVKSDLDISSEEDHSVVCVHQDWTICSLRLYGALPLFILCCNEQQSPVSQLSIAVQALTGQKQQVFSSHAVARRCSAIAAAYICCSCAYSGNVHMCAGCVITVI